MATDAKIDKLVASIEKLVATMGKKESSPPPRKKDKAKEDKAKKEERKLIRENEESLDRILRTKTKIEQEDKKQLARMAQLEELYKVTAEMSEKELETRAQQIKVLEEELQARDSIEASATSTLSSIAGIQVGLGDSLSKTLESGVAMEAWGSAAKKLLNPLNLGLSIISSMRTNTVLAMAEFNSGVASVNAVSGAAGQLNDIVYETAEGARFVGVSYGDAAQAIQGLIPTVTNFRDLSKENQIELGQFAAGMQNLGISAETTGAIFDTLTDGLRMFPEEAIEVQNELAKTAIALGIPPQQMADGFSQALPYLSSFGKDAPKIFTKVSAAAKKLSVDTGTLIEMTKQFDTFEGAAQSAGQLNALLGGSMLNSYDLLNASADQRIKMVLSAVDANGKEWDSMSRFEKMAIANSAGIQDMAEANKIFGGGLSAYEDAETALENVAVSQEDLEEAQRASLDTTKKLSAVMNALSVGVQPLVKVFNGFLDLILMLNKNFPNAIRYTFGLAAAATAVYVAFKLWRGLKGLSGLLGEDGIAGKAKKAIPEIWKFAKAKLGLANAERELNDAKGKIPPKRPGKSFAQRLKDIGKVGKEVGGGLIKIGQAFLLIGAGVAIAAFGVAQFVKAFSGMEPVQILAVSVALLVFLGAMVAMVFILTKMSPVTAVAAASMLALGGAFMLIGVGIALAAVGIGYMVQNMSGLGSAMEPVLLAVSTLSAAFGALMLAVANPLSLIGFAALAGSIATIAFALRAIPEDKSLAFSNVMDSVVKYSNVTEEPNIENVERMIELAGDYQEVQSEMKLPALDSFVQALKGALGAGKDSAPSGASSSGNTEIVLKLNEREMGRAVFDLMGDKMKNVVLDRG